MKLQGKLSLVFASVLGTGLAVGGVFAHRFLEESAKTQVLQQARLMLQAALSMRQYTSEEIAPLLDTPTMRSTRFLPQAIPFYAATQSFGTLRRQYHEYTYKEAAMNPTNLRDRAVDWEADLITAFRNNPGRRELLGERNTPTGPSLFIARPIQVDEECLECHSTAETAPAGITRIYGSSHGFGWKPSEVVGAQIVSVPEGVPIRIAQQAFRNLMIYLAAVAGAALMILNLALYLTVIRPVSKLSAAAFEISNGNMEVPELPISGNDEIATLAASFNRMYVSLAKALRMLQS
jgi:protein-histidine pros-kinase